MRDAVMLKAMSVFSAYDGDDKGRGKRMRRQAVETKEILNETRVLRQVRDTARRKSDATDGVCEPRRLGSLRTIAFHNINGRPQSNSDIVGVFSKMMDNVRSVGSSAGSFSAAGSLENDFGTDCTEQGETTLTTFQSGGGNEKKKETLQSMPSLHLALQPPGTVSYTRPKEPAYLPALPSSFQSVNPRGLGR